MKNAVHLWIKEKANYIYYNKYEKNAYLMFYNRVENAFLQAMIHTEDHEPTPFYISKKLKSKDINFAFKNFVQGKNTAKSFNQKHYASLQDMVDKIYLFNNFTKLNDIEKQQLYFKHMGNAKDELMHSHYLETIDPVRYSKFLNLSDLNELNKNFSLNNINDFLDAIKQQISKTTEFKEIEEIGYFYPVQYKHNTFDDKHYLFEINPYKFHLKHIQKSKIDKFLFSYYNSEYYEKKQIFYSTYIEDMIPLHSGAVFTPSVAYFNPFQILEKKYQEELSTFKKYINDNMNKEAAQELWMVLFEKINLLAFYYVIAQFKNLVSSILIKEHKSKNYSKKSFVKFLIDNETTLPVQEKRKLEVLNKMYQFYEKHQLLKNHKIKAEDLGIYDSDEKKIFDDIEQSIDLFYSKRASLQLLYTYGLNEIKKLLKDFKVPQKFYKSFKPLLLDIITFETPSNMKNMHNDYIHKIHISANRNKLMELYGFSMEL